MNKKDLERLTELRDQMIELSGEFNELSEKTGFGSRTGIIEADISESCEEYFYNEALDEGMNDDDANAYAKKKALDPEAIKEFFENMEQYPYATIYSTDRGWFTSGLNC